MGKRAANRKGTGRRKAKSQSSKGNVFERLDLLRDRIGQNPDDGGAWKELAKICLEQNELAAALKPARRAAELLPGDAEVISMRGAVEYNEGNIEIAIQLFQQVIELTPKRAQPYHDLAMIVHRQAQHQKALELIDKGLTLEPDNMRLLDIKGAALRALHRLDESFATYKKLVEAHPDVFTLWIDLGNLHHDLGDIDAALRCYAKAKTLSGKDATAYSNQLTTLHYHPGKTREQILQTCLEWQKRYAPSEAQVANHITDLSPSRPLRIGMISDGFRKNPVGLMITSALENIPKGHYEFYAYTTNNVVDSVTQRLQKVCTRWIPITQAHGERLRDQIAGDEIDILIDLAGHHKGSRMTALAMKPAPLIVKWVGGLINTTGVDAIDYLISDNIETPDGVDEYYTEKLIRMPDDYICYDPPEYAPAVNELPAVNNGFITFGCFNNPLKINPVLANEWAEILKQHSGSKLFLKSFQYNSAVLCDKVAGWFTECGIERSRLIFEGSSPHSELLKAYNRVDIALDPWPYSGGLTTCEALLMGVPVITLPGPTFAGRHSATHLVNAGMPELVTNTWDEYRLRVKDLTSDLGSLSTIRSHLRSVLHQSNVCNATTFANNLDNVLRAIWQRYTEGKRPAALSVQSSGEIYFEGESTKLELQHPAPETEDASFRWEFEGKVIAIDHGGQLLQAPATERMLKMGSIELFTFDPASNHLKSPLRQAEGVHYYPNMLLGSGAPATLYACQDPKLTGTLKPIEDESFSEELTTKLAPLAEIQLNTLELDKVNDLPSIEWLVLDDLNSTIDVLKYGAIALKNLLIIQANIALRPTHEDQPSFENISAWATHNDFTFYGLIDRETGTLLSREVTYACNNESEKVAALFIPTKGRLSSLSASKLMKLAYISDTAYSLIELSHEVLSLIDNNTAENYNRYKKSHSNEKHISSLKKQDIKPKNDDLSTIKKEPSEAKKFISQSYKKPFDWDLTDPILVVDIGANPIDGTPPYKALLENGIVKVIGFEPQPEALAKLNQQKGSNETYLPYAVGDGTSKTLYVCHASGMTSTFEPNFSLLNRFQGYPEWAKIKEEVPIQTHRLDDLDTIPPVDWLKIDIQGGELNVFEHAESKLKDCLVIQTEVNFIPLYKGQPLFAEIDQWMRAHGFMLHTLIEQRKRLYAPAVINNQIHQGINQLTTADAVYIIDLERIENLPISQINKLIAILHEVYGSQDTVLHIFDKISKTRKNKYLSYLQKKEEIYLKNIFIAGCGHTGTTLIASMLGSNPDIYTINRETNWFLNDTPGDILSTEYAIEAKKAISFNAEYICEKTPNHLYRIDIIKEYFPESLFILTLRNPLDVVASLKRRTKSFDYALKRCLADQEEVIRKSSRKDVFLLRYEDLITDTATMLKKVCKFLSIKYDSRMIEYHRDNKEWFQIKSPKETSGIGEQNHIERRAWQMQQPISDNRGIWKEILTMEEVDIVRSKCSNIFRLGKY